MAISEVLRKQLDKMSITEMRLNTWLTLNRTAIEVKAHGFRKEGFSNEFIEKWRDHMYNKLIEDYRKELEKIRESHN